MIRLITSDIDGTLLQQKRSALSQEQMDLIRECVRMGIRFAAASGRQYPSLQRLFAPLQDEMLFIAENGALIMQHDEPLFSRPISKEVGRQVLRTISSHKNHEALLCCARTCYICNRKGDFLREETKRLGNTVTFVDDLEEVQDEWLKISAFLPDGNATEEAEHYVPFWDQKLLYVAVAGRQWVDFGRASKGTALRFLQRHLHISRDETLTFGDNFNDVEMFRSSGHSYAMASSAQGVRQASGKVAQTVEEVLRALIAKGGTL